MVENSVSRSMQQRQPVLPDLRIRRVHQNFVEEQIDLGPQRGDAISASRCGCAAAHALEFVRTDPASGPGFEQFRLGPRRRP